MKRRRGVAVLGFDNMTKSFTKDEKHNFSPNKH